MIEDNYFSENLFSFDRREQLAGLITTITLREASGDNMPQARAVHERLSNLLSAPNPLGLGNFMHRFTCITAGDGGWEALAESDPRLPKLLLDYLTIDEATTASLGNSIGITQERASHLLRKGLRRLWKHMPNEPTTTFPLDKHVALSIIQVLDLGLVKHARRMRVRAHPNIDRHW